MTIDQTEITGRALFEADRASIAAADGLPPERWEDADVACQQSWNIIAASKTKITDPRAEIWATAVRIWQSDERARDFLERPHMLLGDQRPYIVALQSPEGANMVLQILGRLEAGTAP